MRHPNHQNTPETPSLTDYTDDRGNSIRCGDNVMVTGKLSITFKGSGNTVTIRSNAHFDRLIIDFEGDGNTVDIDHSVPGSLHRLRMRLGHGSSITIGPNCSQQAEVYLTASEGNSITMGSDVMCASRVEIRGTDTHAIYSLDDRTRLNPSADIVIGDHVWLAMEVVLLPGAIIGSNSVIGLRSVVTGEIPDSVVAVGVPAKVVKRNIDWERPVTFGFKP